MEIVSAAGHVSIRDIFGSSAWQTFRRQHSVRIRPVVVQNIEEKVLKCRTGALGYGLLRCKCGKEKRVPFTCKSRFCSSCGKVACDQWMEKVISWALPQMQYQHIVFTIPSELRDF
jgi:hypothetical protein